MTIRTELKRDGDRCQCGRLLAEAELSRVETRDRLDILAICAGCRLPVVIEWVAAA